MGTANESHQAFTWVCVALAVAVVAGTAFVLGMRAFLADFWWGFCNPGQAVRDAFRRNRLAQ